MDARLRTVQAELRQLKARFDAHMENENVETETLTRIEKTLNDNTDKTNEMYEAFMPAKQGLTFLALLARVTKAAFWPIAALAALITYFKTGHWQSPPLP